MKSYVIYLAEKLPSKPGPKYLLTIEQKGSPHAGTSCPTAVSVWKASSPGEYTLIIWTPQASYVIPDADWEERAADRGPPG